MVFKPSATPPSNGGVTEFLPKFIPTLIYRIHRQTEPIDRIEAISVSNGGVNDFKSSAEKIKLKKMK